MGKNIKPHINPARLNHLPEELRLELKMARTKRGWTQAELGRRTGLPQAHISGIETGKIVPRFDTLLDLVRVLGRDLLLVPRELVPAVQSLIRDHRRQADKTYEDEEERPLYAMNDEEEGSGYGYGDYGKGSSDGSGFGSGNYGRQPKRGRRKTK